MQYSRASGRELFREAVSSAGPDVNSFVLHRLRSGGTTATAAAGVLQTATFMKASKTCFNHPVPRSVSDSSAKSISSKDYALPCAVPCMAGCWTDVFGGVYACGGRHMRVYVRVVLSASAGSTEYNYY